MHILSGRSYATLSNDKSILWYDREISLKWGQTKTSTTKKKSNPTFDQIKQFEQLLSTFLIDTVETIASN